MNRALSRAALALALFFCAPLAEAMTIQKVAGADGLTAWLVEDHSLPIVTVRFAFPTGAALDPAGQRGVAAMAAALLAEGAGPYRSQAFQSRLEDLATDLYFDAGQDQLEGNLRSLKRNLDASARLLRLALTAPRFDPDAVARVRGEIVASLSRAAQSPSDLSGRLWMRAAFEHHPYARDIDGSATSIGHITAADLRAFAAERLHRPGLVIGAVGDITPKELRALIDRVFGGLPTSPVAAAVADTKPIEDGALIVSRRRVAQSVVTFGQVGPKRDDPHWYAALVVNDILGGGDFRGRLMRDIREKRGLAYNVSSDLVPLRHAGLLLGSVATANAHVGEVIRLIRGEWNRMRDKGPTAAELAASKSYLTGSFPLTLSSTGQVAETLVQMQTEKLGIDYLDRRAALIGGVSLEEARAEARRLLDPKGLSFAVVGDPPGVAASRAAPAL
ncbi:MAG TPA: pitrilysin family protein [Stellaceae bacterium]|nr:pitrilysin family protein [Stellaceae bacterium]